MDAAGNLHSIRRGKVTRYRYDALKRMTFAGFFRFHQSVPGR